MEPGCPAPLPSCRHLRRARRRAARSTAHPLSLSESPAMSVAFRRESDDEHKEPEFELPIPVGPNLVTPRGNRLLGEAVARLEAAVAAEPDEAARKKIQRPLRYFGTRKATAEVRIDRKSTRLNSSH